MVYSIIVFCHFKLLCSLFGAYLFADVLWLVGLCKMQN